MTTSMCPVTEPNPPETASHSSHPRWPMILILLLLAASVVVNHGCHGAGVDNELFFREWVIRAIPN